MNLNKLALEISHNEVGSISVDVDQIKEIIKCMSIEMALNPALGDMLIEKGMEYIRESNETGEF